MESLPPPSACGSLCVSPFSLMADNLAVALQMAGHDSEVHFPELSYSLRSPQFTAQSTGGVPAALLSGV